MNLKGFNFLCYVIAVALIFYLVREIFYFFYFFEYLNKFSVLADTYIRQLDSIDGLFNFFLDKLR